MLEGLLGAKATAYRVEILITEQAMLFRRPVAVFTIRVAFAANRIIVMKKSCSALALLIYCRNIVHSTGYYLLEIKLAYFLNSREDWFRLRVDIAHAKEGNSVFF